MSCLGFAERKASIRKDQESSRALRSIAARHQSFVPIHKRDVRRIFSNSNNASIAQRAALSQTETPSPLVVSDGSCAVVIGSGIAGLVTAYRLSQCFDKVVVLERDHDNNVDFDVGNVDNWPTRKGVAQFSHLHALLAGGAKALIELYPTIQQDLQSRGARQLDIGSDAAAYIIGKRLNCTDPVVSTFHCSRPLLESYLRQQAQARPNIQFITGVVVNGLEYNIATERVTGVRLTDSTVVAADLVIDASGRNSKLSDWLQTAGLQAPPAELVDPKLTYAAVTLRTNERFSGRGCVTEELMPGVCGTVFISYENDIGIVNVYAYNGVVPPADKDELIAFAEVTPSKLPAEALRECEWLSDVRYFRGFKDLWRQYHKINMPENLCVLGDAVCSFNPVYGQGMTVGILESKILADMLASRVSTVGSTTRFDAKGLANEFHKAAAGLVNDAWLASAGRDLARTGMEPANPSPIEQFVKAYFDACLRCSWEDSVVANAYVRVANMLQPATSMFALAHRVLPFMLRQFISRLLQRSARTDSQPSAPPAAVPPASAL